MRPPAWAATPRRVWLWLHSIQRGTSSSSTVSDLGTAARVSTKMALEEWELEDLRSRRTFDVAEASPRRARNALDRVARQARRRLCAASRSATSSSGGAVSSDAFSRLALVMT